MKVGTDSVLLGAWAQVGGCRHILDVGCGSGVVSLMVAQREPQAKVCGIDIQSEAVCQARENVQASPFRERIDILEEDVRKFVGKFDCVVCNPPFFTEDTFPVDNGRLLARNASSLAYEELWQAVGRLLSPGGLFNVVIPNQSYADFTSIAIGCGFEVSRKLYVRTVQRKTPKRVLVTYQRDGCTDHEEGELVLQNVDGSRSQDYEKLTEDFYLSVPE